MAGANDTTLPVVTTENRDASGPFLIVCEHASNHFPPEFGTLGLDAATRAAHVAWDPGALSLARRLSHALDAPLVSAGISRLIYDLNRPPHAPGAMAARSEVFDVPGNAALTPEERQKRTERVYLPFHSALHAEIARRLSNGRPPVIVTVHSFTPVYHGQRREVELGIIHDADPTFANAVFAEAISLTGFITRLNEPYSAADGVTHTLRMQATPYGLPHVMLEVRNDLLADDLAIATMADGLTPVLTAALARIGAPERKASA
jgi:predicted N-formylglutamate amidohydrolase